MTTISVVVPAFNEVAVAEAFHAQLSAVMNGMPHAWEVIYVNDGSTDGTLDLLCRMQAADAHVGLVNLSRNFGKEAALTAGLEHAGGDAVVLIDADLQDPPELIPALVAVWQRGVDVAYAQRRRRAGESWLKRLTAFAFYRLMARLGRVELPPDVGDFRLMSRRVVQATLQLREHHRFMKGLFAWVGFPSEAVLYDRNPRAAGSTKWTYWTLWNFALDGVTGYTVMPLKISTYLGIGAAVTALAYAAFILVRTLLLGNPVPGYPSLVVITLFMGGAQLITLGIIGEYLGRVFNETKSRPLYLVERFVPASTEAPRLRRIAEVS